MYEEIKSAALKIATEAHASQYYRHDKSPYINHPIAVADIAIQLFNDSIPPYENPNCIEYKKIIAQLYVISLFHDISGDVIEYKNNERLLIDELKIRDSLGQFKTADYVDIEKALTCLNKHRYESYLEFILAAKRDYYARIVKMADLKHNLSDLAKGSLKQKYELALHILKYQ